MKKIFEKRDVLFARVSANLKEKGCFLETVDGETVFMPNFNFQLGTKVICSVFKVTEDKYPLVNLDSVIYDDLAA